MLYIVPCYSYNEEIVWYLIEKEANVKLANNNRSLLLFVNKVVIK